MLEQIIRLSIHADWLALGLSSLWWTGCNHHADHAARSERGLRGVTSHMRLDWAQQTVGTMLLLLAVPYRRDLRSQTLATLAQ